MTSENGSNMDAPVTRRELREELERFVTKDDLRAALERYATKDDLRAALERYATKEDLDLQLGAIFAHFDARFLAMKVELKTELRADLRQELEIFARTLMDHVSSELARHTTAANEQHRVDLSAIDDQYKDLPPRVTRLEQAVFPPKRQRRR